MGRDPPLEEGSTACRSDPDPRVPRRYPVTAPDAGVPGHAQRRVEATLDELLDACSRRLFAGVDEFVRTNTTGLAEPDHPVARGAVEPANSVAEICTARRNDQARRRDG